MKMVVKNTENNRGEIMLEAMIIFPTIVIILFFIIALFSIYYQHWNYNIIAEEIAMRVAQTYKYTGADVLEGSVQLEEIANLSPYRYWFYQDDFSGAAQRKANTIAKGRSNMLFGGENISVKTNVVKDTMGRRHVEVTFTAKYSVPFGGMFELLGIGKFTECKVVTYADCYDATNYLNTVDFVARVTNDKKLDIISEALDLITSIFGIDVP
ncbi:MAG: hypothetical protein MJ172_08055 [Clostridia bacterium]|nr:hypothetical protein [Clostridia bacterium]